MGVVCALSFLACPILLLNPPAATANSHLLGTVKMSDWQGEKCKLWGDVKGIVPRSYVCPRVNPAMPVDVESGDVRTAAWDHADWTEPFVDIEGDKKPTPWLKTRMKMMWDDEALYVGAWMEEQQVVATLKERDSVIFHDNDFELFINGEACFLPQPTEGDNHNYYEFEVNAFNTIWELRLNKPYRDGGGEHSERVGMTGQGRLPNLRSGVLVDGTINDPTSHDLGWGVVMRVPFDDLVRAGHCKASPQRGSVWRVQSSRVQWKWEWEAGAGGATGSWKKVRQAGHGNEGEDNWTWTPQGVINVHNPERWGFVHFAESTADSAGGPTPDWEAREALMEAYYHIADYAKAHGRPPSTLQDARVDTRGLEVGIDVGDDVEGGYVVWVRVDGGGRMCVRSDSWLWTESA